MSDRRAGRAGRVSLDVRATAADATIAAAERVVADANAAIHATGRFLIALSGGSTPRALYTLLAAPAYTARIDWSRVHVVWSDERCLPPDDRASNFRMARETLLDAVSIPRAQVHRVHGEDEPAHAARAYERDLLGVFPATGPRFDLVLLGMGVDGHTASLFPGLTAVHETSRLVVAEYVPQVAMWRVTLTAPAINAAAAVIFLVTGSEKARALRRVFEEAHDPDGCPAQVVAPRDGDVTWVTDLAAAALLTEK